MVAFIRYRRAGLTAALLCAGLTGSSTATGRQDIASLLAHQPGVTERARLSLYSGAFQTLKTATFAWPAARAPLGGALSEDMAPKISLNEINRAPKTDRLANGTQTRLEPEDEAGQITPGSSIGSGTSTLATSSTGTGSATGTGISTIDAGIGTDPSEADDVTDTPDRMARAREGLDSVPAGDPTGDPAVLEAGADQRQDLAGAAGTQSTPVPAITFSADTPIYRESVLIFTLDSDALPPQPFLHAEPALAEDGATRGQTYAAARGPSPAERLGLEGKRRERSLKCLAEAVYFESRGEPERGQVAVAQVVMNRVFSGYYPADICRAVYQNAHRKLACQFTFACDNIKDVVTEPRLWRQAQRIATDMLDGAIWDEQVGRATHYHAHSVRPNWIREMRKLERIGEHTFYRPRRWTS